MRSCTLVFGLLISHAIFGQARHQLSAGFTGVVRLRGNSYDAGNRPGFGGAYGLRAHRYFQIDLGLEVVPRPIGAGACCRYVKNAGDILYLIPFGGRLVLGPEDGRWEIDVGGGAAYMNHHVGNQAPGISPGASGAGGYGLAGGNSALRKGSRLRLGGHAKFYRFGLNGFTPARYLTLAAEFSFRF
jgi:hypothetical protein